MKLKFDPGLDYQQEAIASTLAVFDGLTKDDEAYRRLGIANTLTLNPDKLLATSKKHKNKTSLKNPVACMQRMMLTLFQTFR